MLDPRGIRPISVQHCSWLIARANKDEGQINIEEGNYLSGMKEFQYSREFDREYEYKGDDLGALCEEGKTCFKLWAPFADKVELCLYAEADSASGRCLSMEAVGRGLWQLNFPESLHGTYYDYLIWNGKGSVQTADPYARGCCCNGARSMVVDLRLTDPEGFAEDRAPGKSSETIIYELHIKDFSFDPNSGVQKAFRGKYKAFTVQGGNGSYPTVIAYLKQLGITHVHLLPFFDFGWLDEAGGDEQFNWGYDPLNYNVPEGSFATDVKDGTVRIRECKEMIQALHRAGIRVIMDVVYNHTHDAESWLERTAPGYFNRRLKNGELSDGSACGNDMAVGRAMVDNYIANSVMYWSKEYHIDGFRFDLMGLMTTELMNRIQLELDEAFGSGEKLLYGEPWRANESPMEAGTHAALKDNVKLLDERIAVFSDDTRDVIKGDVFFAKAPGFVNGGTKLEDRILDAVAGWKDNFGGFHPKSCSQIINYVSAHDNFTLWDKLLLTMRQDKEMKEEEYLTPYDDILAANKLAAFIYFTCQGYIFFQAGEEFGRTKFGDENSYRSAPEVNMLRWEQTEVFRELVSYYQGLIALRKELPGLYDKSSLASGRISGRTVHREGVVSFFVDNRDSHASGKRNWEKLYVMYNASDTAYTTEPETGDWEILVDADTANCRKQAVGKVTVAPHSGLLLGRCYNASADVEIPVGE